MGQRIVLMTANVQGGIIQFTFQLYHTLKALGHNVKVCLPQQMHDSNINEIDEADRLLYYKEKRVLSNRSYKALAGRIMETSADYIWYCDDSVICSKVGLFINDPNIRQLLTMHDAGGYHPTYHEKLRSKAIRCYSRWVNQSFYKKIHRFVLLSQECEKLFCSRFPGLQSRVVCMNLGAHIPREPEKKPDELFGMEETPYLLFFGRIDRYKGIGNLLRAYGPVADAALPLIIAGSGTLSQEETELINGIQNVTLINRYIYDGEMKWLVSHSTSVVLPYIEATQSGVIPIAYAYAKPVIVSNVSGLTQFVQNQVTGFVAEDETAMREALKAMTVKKAESMGSAAVRFHDEHLNWQHNVERMLSNL